MKILYVLFAVAILCTACSKNEIIVDPEPEPLPEKQLPNSYPVFLEVDRNNTSIFKQVIFTLRDSLYHGENEDIALFLNYDFLDSLVWTIDGAKKTKHLIKRTSAGSNTFTSSWSHNFYKPGDYEVALKGYFKGKLVVNDSTKLHVAIGDMEDFLHLSWKDVIDSASNGLTYDNNGFQDYMLSIYAGIYNGVKSASLATMFNDVKSMDEADASGRNGEILTSYITELYGEPKAIESKDSLIAYYEKHFKNPLGKDVVYRVWQTEKTNMALIKYLNEVNSKERYKIHAEPRF